MKFVKRIGGETAIGVAMMFGFGLFAPLAQAAYFVTLAQQGSDVVASGGGTIDLTDLVAGASGATSANMSPLFGNILTGLVTLAVIDLYSGITGPTSFGSGGATAENADSGSGDMVGIWGSAQNLLVPDGYVSGNELSSTATWTNQTFSGLGVTPGPYVWMWGSGAHADFFQLGIIEGAAAVPEPSSVLLLALSFGLVVILTVLRPPSRFTRT